MLGSDCNIIRQLIMIFDGQLIVTFVKDKLPKLGFIMNQIRIIFITAAFENNRRSTASEIDDGIAAVKRTIYFPYMIKIPTIKRGGNFHRRRGR